MKDFNSCRLMQWLMKKGIPAHKAYDYISYLGFGTFWLSLLPSILIQDLELSGWLGSVCAIFMALIMLSLLAVSGYCIWQANFLWLMLLLFGPVDIIMGLAIDLGTVWRIVFTAVGVALTGAGIYLAPKQLRNSKNLKPKLDAARKLWERERMVRIPKETKKPETAAPTPPKTETSRIEQLKIRLHILETLQERLRKSGKTEQLQEAQGKYEAAAEALGKQLLEEPELFVLRCRFPGGNPVFLGTDGRMEMFTDRALAESAQGILQRAMQAEMEVRTLSGPAEIRSFFADCSYNGFQVLRLDNGGKFPGELWLKAFFPHQEKHLIDEKNRSLRYMFHRTKLYSHLLGGRTDMTIQRDHSLAEMMITMRLNGYRELGKTLVYALSDPMEEDRVHVTRAALEKLRQWLPGSGYEDSGADALPVYDGSLRLCFVNRPGQQGIVEQGMVCVFTSLDQAEKGRALFRSSGMEHSIVAITFEELLAQAVQCAGIVVDMQTLSYEIPKSEYQKINEVRQLDGPILVNLKQSEAQKSAATQQPQLRHTEVKNGWQQFDYQWPHRFGYDYILKNAQWLIDHDLQVQTLTTAEIAGAPEKEHIEELRSCGSLAECVGRETGVLAVGGASRQVDHLLKVFWFNQTNVVRIFTLGEVEQSRMDVFAAMLFQERENP